MNGRRILECAEAGYLFRKRACFEQEQGIWQGVLASLMVTTNDVIVADVLTFRAAGTFMLARNVQQFP